jgi:hypothetical protein
MFSSVMVRAMEADRNVMQSDPLGMMADVLKWIYTKYKTN